MKQLLKDTLTPVIQDRAEEMKADPGKYQNIASAKTYPINESTTQEEKLRILAEYCHDIGIDMGDTIYRGSIMQEWVSRLDEGGK